MIGKKRKIRFQVTVGSAWAVVPHFWIEDFKMPMGGVFGIRVIEFIQQTENPFKEACDLLGEEISDTYHIWYWSWLDY